MHTTVYRFPPSGLNSSFHFRNITGLCQPFFLSLYGNSLGDITGDLLNTVKQGQQRRINIVKCW